MINTGFGIAELIVAFLVTVISLALPVAILFLLYKIYLKLKDIEEQLRKK